MFSFPSLCTVPFKGAFSLPFEMSFKNPKFWQISSSNFRWRCYSSSNRRVNFNKLRPMILKRIENRGNSYPLPSMIPVARQVLNSRAALYDGVSALLHHIPVWSCKYCPEVYIGEGGHLIRSCRGYKHHAKNRVHSWVEGTIKDVIVSVETFHLQKMFQKVIKHDERFNFDRIPAVLELCLQAGAYSNDENISSDINYSSMQGNISISPEPLSTDDLRVLGLRTLKAWETLRSGVDKLLCVYPARVCKHCSEVHVGPSGHKARMCGVFKYESWRGTHFWEKANVDDLVPPNLVWYRRRQDPPILVEEGRGYYGRAPVVIDLCSKAGVIVPSKYFCMMKFDGLSPDVSCHV